MESTEEWLARIGKAVKGMSEQELRTLYDSVKLSLDPDLQERIDREGGGRMG